MDTAPTIDGELLLTVKKTGKTLNCGRSTIYRLIKDNRLEVVNIKGIGPRITARSVLRAAGMQPEGGNR